MSVLPGGRGPPAHHVLCWDEQQARPLGRNPGGRFDEPRVVADVDTEPVIGRGELIADESLADFAARGTRSYVTVRTPDAVALAARLDAAGATARPDGDQALTVTGLDAVQISDLAFNHRILIHELVTHAASLEEAFMELTAEAVEHRAEGLR